MLIKCLSSRRMPTRGMRACPGMTSHLYRKITSPHPPVVGPAKDTAKISSAAARSATSTITDVLFWPPITLTMFSGCTFSNAARASAAAHRRRAAAALIQAGKLAASRCAAATISTAAARSASKLRS